MPSYNKNPKPNKLNKLNKMKKSYIILLLIATFIFISCENEELTLNELNQLNTNNELNSESKSFGTGNDYLNNQIIIQYVDGSSEVQKQVLRDQYSVVSYKTCECEDPTLELWYFDTTTQQGDGGVNVEEKLDGSKGESIVEGGDYNLNIQQYGHKLGASFGIPDVNVALQKVVNTNQNVTIAILDTGIDYNYYKFTVPFLYNNSLNSDSCTNDSDLQDYYGWDFVNQDNDPYDDYGHGTMVASFIYDKLTTQNVNFQILPIKVFDANGKGNYFDLLCGYKYAINNSDVDIINMSFGWYNNNNHELLNKFILESNEKVLITASAGNYGTDTDNTPHSPSTFDSENILSIASLNNNGTNLARFSNFGRQTVDIAARGKNIPFHLSQNEIIYVSGTSYSNAYATAFAGEKYMPDMSVEEHIIAVISNTIPNNNLSRIKYSSFVPYY